MLKIDNLEFVMWIEGKKEACKAQGCNCAVEAYNDVMKWIIENAK